MKEEYTLEQAFDSLIVQVNLIEQNSNNEK